MGMTKGVWRVVWGSAALALVGLGVSGCLGRGGTSAGAGDTLLVVTSQAARGGVGVVRRTELLVAYTKSDERAAVINGLIAARDEARAAGRTEEVARIEALGAEMQEIAHRQLAGREPLYNVVLGVEGELRAIMEARGLSRVLEAGPGVEGVDITDDLVAAIEARGSGA